MRRTSFRSLVAGVGVTVLLGAGVAGSGGVLRAQPTQASDMEQRLNQVIQILQDGSPGAAQGAIDRAMEILYGGLRPLPTQGPALEQTTQADQAVGQNEIRLAGALETAANRTELPQDVQRQAVDVKLFIEEMNEVARAIGAVTRQCGEGDSLNQPPCDELQQVLDEGTGAEMPPRSTQQQDTIAAGYSVKLRGPAVPIWIGTVEEDVRVTDPLRDGQCAAVFKEQRGLSVVLHFDRIIIVTDPWVSTFGVPRGTAVPIWRLEWIPTQYAKTWVFCNRGGRNVVVSERQRVKQDVAVNYLWRYYGKDP